MKHNVFIVVALLLFMLFSSGCQKKTTAYVGDIEQDGEVYSIYPSELSTTEIEDDYINGVIRRLKNDLNLRYRSSDVYVDKGTYSFLVVVPIKSKTNLRAGDFNGCTNFNIVDFAISNITTNLSDDGYYHYKSYAASSSLAQIYHLNDIKDKELYFNCQFSDMTKKINITSNKFTVQSEEFEHMLDRLAISHERLSFQPEGY